MKRTSPLVRTISLARVGMTQFTSLLRATDIYGTFVHGMQQLSCRGRAATMSLLFMATTPLVTPLNAADVYGTFVAHVIYMDGPSGSNFDSNFKVTNIVTTPSGTISVPHGYTIPPGYTNSNVTFQTIQVQVNAPAVLPKAAVVGGALESPTSRLDFVTYGGNVPVTNRASGVLVNGNSTERTIYASGLLSPGGQQGKLAGHPVGHNVVLPEVSAPLPPNSSATVAVEGSGSTEIAQFAGAFHGGDAGFPPTTRAVFLSQLYVGNRTGTVRVDIRTYYDFSSEPKFPKIDVEGLSPGECTPGAAGGAALLAADVCTPPSVSFGTVLVNSYRRRPFIIVNKGKAPLEIQSTPLTDGLGLSIKEVYGADAGFPPYIIPVGGRLQVMLNWSPQSVVDLKAANATVTIASNDPERPNLVRPLHGQSVGSPGYSSTPDAGSGIHFGDKVVVAVKRTRQLYIANRGSTNLVIDSLEFVGDAPGLTKESGTLPAVLSPNGAFLTVRLGWEPKMVTDLGTSGAVLRVRTNDPNHSVVDYSLHGTSVIDADAVLEDIFVGWIAGGQQVAAKPASKAATASERETATLTLDPAATKSLTAQVPAFLGGGSVQLSEFTGSLTVSLISFPGDSETKRIEIDGGLLTAPSIQLPSGLSTGLNTLVFGLPAESSGTLEIATGNYTASAAATIYNQLIPSGVTVRGNYSGVYNAQTQKISVQSQSEDLFVPNDRLLNISTRMRVLTGDNVLIGGFIITGSEAKKVIIRGIAPSLSGVGATLPDPTLELRQGDTLIASNDDWKQNQAEVEATTIPPTNDLEPAIVATLDPGAYTAILAGKNNATGVGVVEVYDLALAADSKLANISSRGFVDTGNNVMIGGFIIGSPVVVNGVGVPQGGARALVRAIGPSLGDAGVPNSLPDPTLELRDGNGALVDANDNWRSDHEAEIQATTIPPLRDEESAIVRTLTAGAYTAIVRGAGNTTGVAVVEVYNLQ